MLQNIYLKQWTTAELCNLGEAVTLKKKKKKKRHQSSFKDLNAAYTGQTKPGTAAALPNTLVLPRSDPNTGGPKRFTEIDHFEIKH